MTHNKNSEYMKNSGGKKLNIINICPTFCQNIFAKRIT